MGNLTKCRTCGKEVSTTAPTCPHCGEIKPGEKDPLTCPNCGSKNVGIVEKSFNVGKAAKGGILLGPIGLLGGLIGKKGKIFICHDCAYKGDWSTGDE